MSGITPIEFNVVVRPDKVAEKSARGVYMPDAVVERDQGAMTKGTLVAVSPMAFAFDEWPEDMPKPQAGQRVAFIKFAGTEVEGADGEDYRVMKDRDVLAVLE